MPEKTKKDKIKIDPKFINEFITGGRCCFSAISSKTGEKYTFLVKRSDIDETFMVTLLNKPGNEKGELSFLGFLQGNSLRYHKKCPYDVDSNVIRVSQWIFSHIFSKNDAIFEKMSIFYNGKCSKCGKSTESPYGLCGFC